MKIIRPILFALLLLSIFASGCSDSVGSQNDKPDICEDCADMSGPDSGAVDMTDECFDQCDSRAQTECHEGGVRECIEVDGCLVWSAPTFCASNATCTDGACRAFCPEQECTVLGARQCDGDGVVECVDSDSDGCLEWSEPTACGPGESCSSGFCAVGCSDECSSIGTRQCQGNAVAECGDFDSDSCLEWGARTECGSDFCVSGRCETSCTDECSSSQARRCDASGFQRCDDHDSDGCLEWGTTVSCAAGESCSNGFCASGCTDECTTTGARMCSGDAVVECGDFDSDACLEWGSSSPCASGEVCSSGYCAQSCTDECTVDGAKGCDLGGVITCGNFDADSCLEWSNPVACSGSQVCSGGNCALTCTDECNSVNERQCTSGSTTDFQVCDDHDADGCLEWGSAQTCPATQVCSGGNCAQTCTDECSTSGTSQCVDSGSTRTCGDYDADSCLEWGTTVFCAGTETCQSGQCQMRPAPTGLVISEVFYDATGSDDDAFVEIHGPAGTDLNGVELVGINGNGGGEYNVISLSGSIPSDGLFVVANSAAAAATLAEADLTDPDADYQNGPDSIVLRFGTSVLDAVGYGTFSGSDVFAGEGNPVAGVAAGKSIARDANFSDTDDNLTDFTPSDTPTPGAGRGQGPSTSQPPTAVFTVIPTSSTRVLVDASPSVDDVTPSGSLEVRWDWDDDGTYDTTWTTTKTATHTYATSASVTIGLEVRDADGQTASTTESLDLSIATTNVSGSITTDTTWSGNILLVNDVTIASGATLTISAGTRVMALYVDDDYDVPGDVALINEGNLVINGSTSAPVVFTAYEASRKYAGSWQGIYNDGSMTTANTIIEYAEKGIESVTSNQTISGVTARLNMTGMQARGLNLDLQNLTFDSNDRGLWLGCEWYSRTVGSCRNAASSDAIVAISNVVANRNQTGLRIEAHERDSVSLFQVTATHNHHGIEILGTGEAGDNSDSADVTISRSTFSDNTGVGIFAGRHELGRDKWILDTVSITQTDIERNLIGVRQNDYALGGNIEFNNIRDNAYVGFMIEGLNSNGGWRTPTNNNLDSNGSAAGISTVTAGQVYTETSGSHDYTWSTPAGQQVAGFFGKIENVSSYSSSSNDGEFRVEDAQGYVYATSGWNGTVPDGSGGTYNYRSYSAELEFSDTIFITLSAHPYNYSDPILHIGDVLVFDTAAGPTDVLAFSDMTLTGNYLGSASSASSRIYSPSGVTVDTTGLASAPISTAGR